MILFLMCYYLGSDLIEEKQLDCVYMCQMRARTDWHRLKTLQIHRQQMLYRRAQHVQDFQKVSQVLDR